MSDSEQFCVPDERGATATEYGLLVGFIALVIVIGVALFAARLVPAFATVLGWPTARFGGASGQLAQGNARRNPQRTASTAAALMIGLALVTGQRQTEEPAQYRRVDQDRPEHEREQNVGDVGGFR